MAAVVSIVAALLAALLLVISTQGAYIMHYRFVNKLPCKPPETFFMSEPYCSIGLDTRPPVRCVCNKTANTLDVYMREWATNETHEWLIDVPVARHTIGACHVLNGEPALLLADSPDVCGPTIQETIEHGKPFDAASYQAYLASRGRGSGSGSDNSNSPAPLASPSFLLCVLGLVVFAVTVCAK